MKRGKFFLRFGKFSREHTKAEDVGIEILKTFTIQGNHRNARIFDLLDVIRTVAPNKRPDQHKVRLGGDNILRITVVIEYRQGRCLRRIIGSPRDPYDRRTCSNGK